MMRPMAAIGFLLLSSCGSSTDPEALRAAQAEVKRLRDELATRDQDLKALRQAVEQFGEPEKLGALLAAAEAARDKAHRELAVAQAVVSELRERVAADALEAARPPPPPPAETKISDLVERCSPSVVMIKTNFSTGAGFFAGAGGLIITNYHVISGSQKIDVLTFGAAKKERPAKAIAIDLTNDLALLVLKSGEAVAGLELESDNSLRVGDDVFTIGNPGIGDVILAQSVSAGIVSSMSREIEGATYLQTTAPINPGNSGGPLINRAGKVIGVVTAKGVGVENIGFAIPAACVRALFAGKDEIFAVRTSLAEWEREKGFKRAPPPAAGIPVNTMLTKLFLDETLDRIIGLDEGGNGVLTVSITKKSIIGSVFTGLRPACLVPDRDPKVYWVSHAENPYLSKVDVVEGKVLEQVKVERPIYRFVVTADHFWNFGSGLGVIGEKGGRLWQCDFSLVGLTHDRKRNRLLGVDISGNLHEANPESLYPLIRQYQELAGANKPKELHRVGEEIRQRIKFLVTLPRLTSRAQIGHLLLNEKGSRLYANRSVLDLARPNTVLGSLQAATYSRSAEPGVRTFLQRHPYLEHIQAWSPDGRWIATGTHLYSGVRFTVHKELPLPSEAVAFSADSKTLYYFDFLNRCIVPLDVESK